MTIPMYLAMTADEFEDAISPPDYPAWMACHFSCYGSGLENLPIEFPQGSMIVVNDRIPVTHHDAKLILQQLTDLYQKCHPKYFLLDFQQPDVPLLTELAKLLTSKLPCPTAVSHAYATNLGCPVLLPPPPLHVPLKEYIKPWRGREIWMEATLTTQTITVTESGSRISQTLPAPLPEPVFEDSVLHCRYHLELKEKKAIFHLSRTAKEISAFLEEAEQLGIKLAVGLYQQLKNRESK